jgi:peptidyl-prolyl cis-trans isomerase D
MVMRSMRRNTAAVWWIFIILLVAVAIGMIWSGNMSKRDATAAAMVDGESVDGQLYSRMINSRLEQARQNSGGDLTEAESLKIRRDALNDLIDEQLALDHAKSLGQSLSPAEFQQAVMADPSLRDEQGRFDANRYQRVLQMQAEQGLSWQQVEAGFMRGMLLGKIRSFWASQAVLSQAELDAAAARYNRQVKVQALVWNLESLRAKLKVSDEDVHAYYSENKKKWAQPEQLKLRQILIKSDLATGVTGAKAKAASLLAKLKAGADFKALASTENADDAARKNGGELGWLSRGDLRDAALSDAAFKLKPGQVSDVVQTSDGYCIVKAEDRKAGFDPTFANSGAKALKELGAQRAAKQARSLAAQVLAAVNKGQGADQAAKAFQASVTESGWFDRDSAQPLPALGETKDLAKQVLDLDQGQWLDQPTDSPKAVAVLKLSSERPGQAPAKAEAKAARLRDAADSARSKQAEALYKAWLAGLRKPATIVDQSGVLASKD